MTICITGGTTTIAKRLVDMLDDSEQVIPHTKRVLSASFKDNVEGLPFADRYLFAQGKMYGIDVACMDPVQVYNITAISVMQRVAMAFDLNPNARIVVIGSMSAILGSYDVHYACSKAALHHFVNSFPKPKGSTLVCVAPTIISDSGMTERRADYLQVLKERKTVTAQQVAEVCHWVLYRSTAVNHGIIEMTGEKVS